jgi:hypothetical protein
MGHRRVLGVLSHDDPWGLLRTFNDHLATGPLSSTHGYFPRDSGDVSFVIERAIPSVEAFQRAVAAAQDDDDWRGAWSSLRPFVREGRREILEQL